MYGVITGKLCRVGPQMMLLENFFESFLHNYQEELKIISGSKFNFESVELMDYKLHKVRFKRGGFYKKSSEWLVYKSNNKSEK